MPDRGRRLRGDVREREDDDARKRVVLQVVQPALVGLMDGAVSTLAPVFATAFATTRTIFTSTYSHNYRE